MRKLIVAFIVTFLVIAAGLVCLIVYSINGGTVFTTNGMSNMKLVNTQTIDLASTDTINVSYKSSNIVLYPSDTEELIVKEYMNYTPEDNELARINQSGNQLTIQSGKTNRSIFSFQLFSRNRVVELYLPVEYREKLELKTSSGNIVADSSFTFSDFFATCTSGNINIKELYAEEINAKASSGNITFEVAQGNRIISITSGNIKLLGGTGDSDLSTSSGNITVENASGQLRAEATSGNINVIDSIGGGDFKTSSGNIKLELTSLTSDLDISASSGEVSLILPTTESFTFYSKASSGDIRTYFDDKLSFNKRGNEASGTIGENPEQDINIHTSSGNIRVSE